MTKRIQTELSHREHHLHSQLNDREFSFYLNAKIKSTQSVSNDEKVFLKSFDNHKPTFKFVRWHEVAGKTNGEVEINLHRN